MSIKVTDADGKEIPNPVTEVNAAFNFGEPEEIKPDIVDSDSSTKRPSGNGDIPKIPHVKESKGSKDSKDAKRDGTPRSGAKGTPLHRARQEEYRTRIETAREAAPLVAMALGAYLNQRGCYFDTNDANRPVTYWVISTSKGDEKVQGSIAEAMAFHGLAGVGGLNVKLIELIESHPAIFGALYIAGMMVYIEVIIQAAMAKAEQEARAAANVAVQES